MVLKIHPQQTVPTLKDGDLTIWDSHAISSYLINKYAKGSSLYPEDANKRAVVDQRLHFDTGLVFPLFVKLAVSTSLDELNKCLLKVLIAVTNI